MVRRKYERVNYYEILIRTAEKTGYEKKIIDKSSRAFIDMIKDCVSKGVVVNIKGLGKFYSWKKNSRMARNPKTGEKIRTKEKMVVKFNGNSEFLKNLKKSIND
jgi:nucleoid DNA-binding protein